MREPTQICRGFTDDQWRGLEKRLGTGDESAWSCAIEVFERRIRERFFACIEALMDADSKLDVEVPPGASLDCSTLPNDDGKRVVVPGFAIMSLCCLLAETLQSFRESPGKPADTAGPYTYPDGSCVKPVSSPSTNDQFKKFLRRPAFGGAFNDAKIAKKFVDGVRNGILHDAETRGWRIWRDEPLDQIVEPQAEGYALNRNEFYRALKGEFDSYLQDLRNPLNAQLRGSFVKKMSRVAEKC